MSHMKTYGSAEISESCKQQYTDRKLGWTKIGSGNARVLSDQ